MLPMRSDFSANVCNTFCTVTILDDCIIYSMRKIIKRTLLCITSKDTENKFSIELRRYIDYNIHCKYKPMYISPVTILHLESTNKITLRSLYPGLESKVNSCR